MLQRSLLLSTSLLCLGASPSALAEKPNIIVILVDDMGFSDIGCYGSEIPTPNLDALAAEGVRFTQFYNTGRCCPTRACLLTGLYPHQAGVGHMTQDQGEQNPGYRGHLNDSCVTMAEVLRPAGYFTAMSGKWHVGQEHGVAPWTRGFDRNLNAPAGGFYQADSPRARLCLNGEDIDSHDPRLGKDWYSTDLWTDFGIKFIDEAKTAGKPFFLYLAYNAPHFPLQAPEADIAKFRGQYKGGWDKLRAERHARQKQMGLLNTEWELSPRAEAVAAWDSLTADEQDRFDHLMAVYAACVYHMDQAVGRLVDALKQRGLSDNTLILFMSDNGGNAESGPNGKTEGDPTDAKSSWFCGESWANAENTPFRRYKHYNHEGGISTPLIAHWPAEMNNAGGRLVNTPAHLIDIMATVADVGGATYPKTLHDKPITPMEGLSLKPLLVSTTASLPESRPLFWEHEGNAAVRVGDMKLVRQGRQGAWELYDIARDRTELHDLSSSMPGKVTELSALWEAWALRAHVKPYPGEAKAKGKGKGKGGKKKKKAAATE